MIVDPFELRARPELVRELRAHPGQLVERRYAPMRDVQTRASADGGWVLGGLAAVYDDLSVNLGGFRERIARGAFRKILASRPDVRCLFNHDLNLLLGRTDANTLRLKEVAKGLDYEADAPDTSYANDLRVLMDRGDVNQSSFAFRVGQDEWEEDSETGALIRTILEFSDLYDVSPVTDPAYPTTTSGVRGRDQAGTDVPSQHADQARAQEQAGEGDEHEARTDPSTDPDQGEPAEWLVAARQRELKARQILLGR